MSSIETTNAADGVYRTPGRKPDAAALPSPSWRALRAPLVHAAAALALLVAPVLLFNALRVTYALPEGTRFVPAVDHLQDAVALLLPATLLLLVRVVVRRVAPAWRGLRVRNRILYVGGLLLAQLALVVAGEAAVFSARGGLHLFEPTWKSSASGPAWTRAHVYKEGFGCGYDVYVSGPLAITMQHRLHVGRRSCDEALPTVRWNADGALELVDREGRPLEPQSPAPLLWGGGC